MKEKVLGEVYLITCLITGKQYVGITIRGYLNRWKKHLAQSKTKGTGLHEDIHKYGEDAFKIEVLESKQYANRDRLAKWIFNRERFWISHLDTYLNGYNLTEGGDGVAGAHKSKVIRNLMREMMKDLYERHPEEKFNRTRRAHEEARKPENRKRMSELQKKRYEEMTEEERLEHIERTKQGLDNLPIETKERIKKTQFKKGQETWNKGLETPEDVRLKISNSEKGRKAWNKGVSMPEEQKGKISENRKGIAAWNKGKKVERKEVCPVCGKLICWNMMNKHIKARHTKK